MPYKEPCDFWSVGVVLFILLSGSPPFYDEDNFELFEKIKKCQYDLTTPQWDGISAEAKDFISKLLVADPEARLKGDEIMAHPWILGQQSDAKEKNVLEKMRLWNSKRKIDK